MSNPNIEQDIKNAIHMITKSMDDENVKNNPELVELVKKVGVENPEHFNILLCYGLERIVDSALSQIFEKEHNKNKIVFVYMHYDFINSHLSNLFKNTVGWEASTDRSRHIIKGYLEYLKTGKVFAIGNRKDYWVPPFGTAEEWINFTDAVCNLYFRFPTEKEQNSFDAIMTAAKRYQIKREEEEKKYIETRDNTIIDFNVLMDLKIPVILNDMTEGRMFSELLDLYMKDEENPHKNLREFYINCDTDKNVVIISGGTIQIIDETSWTGHKPVPFNHIAKRKERH